MKKITAIIALLVVAGTVSVRAQSGGAVRGQSGAAPVDYARKANTSQTQGKGVPYSKDKEQQQGRAEAKGGTPAASGSSGGSQGSMKSSKKSGAKQKSASSGSGSNQ